VQGLSARSEASDGHSDGASGRILVAQATAEETLTSSRIPLVDGSGSGPAAGPGDPVYRCPTSIRQFANQVSTDGQCVLAIHPEEPQHSSDELSGATFFEWGFMSVVFFRLCVCPSAVLAVALLCRFLSPSLDALNLPCSAGRIRLQRSMTHALGAPCCDGYGAQELLFIVRSSVS
jgi:hypothetical protein